MCSLNLVLGCIKVDAADTLTINSTRYTLQASSSSSPISQDVAHMWYDIKEMESGTLGLTKNSTTDNIDCHMVKNSEYGAALLLTISAYGVGPEACYGNNTEKNTNTDIAKLSSTGNTSGIYQLSANWEWVSAVNNAGTNEYSTWFKDDGNVPAKYKEVYYATQLGAYKSENNGGKGVIKGDALFTKGFLGSYYAYFTYGAYPFFIRGSSIYGFFSYNDYAGSNNMCGRAVVVCGSGL